MKRLPGTLGPLGLLVAIGAPHAAAQSIDRSQLQERVDSVIESALQSGRAAGVSLGVVRAGDTLILAEYGYADLELEVPTPSDAIYEIGSVTKQFTSTAILQLVDEGLIDLDADITTYLPDFPTNGRSYPIRRLMDHTSGIKGYTEMEEFATIATRTLPRDSLVALFAAAPVDFEPGTALIYNNSAYFLLGLVIEAVSGMSYADYVTENLFTRVGMTDSHYCSNSKIVKRRARGYDFRPDGLVRGGYIDHTWPYAAGSLCSTVRDLLIWNAALHGDGTGGYLLSADSYAELVTPGTLNDGTPVRYAKGLGIVDFGGHRMIAHGGGIPGYLSDLRYFPDDDLTIVVLINTAGPVSPATIAREIAGFVLGEPSELPAREFGGDLSELTGEYTGAARGSELTVRVEREGSNLNARIGQGEATTIQFIGDLQFALGDTRFNFLRTNGVISGLQIDQVSGLYVLKKR